MSDIEPLGVIARIIYTEENLVYETNFLPAPVPPLPHVRVLFGCSADPHEPARAATTPASGVARCYNSTRTLGGHFPFGNFLQEFIRNQPIGNLLLPVTSRFFA